MVKKYVFTISLLLIGFSVFSQETFKTMFYNVLNYPLQAPANRIQHLDVILNDYQPDLFMICELNTEAGADVILQTLQNINPNYQRATFVFNTSDDDIGNQNELQQMIYYDSSKFILDTEAIVTTTYRDFNHYKLKLNTVDQATNPVYLDVFVTHLKSSSGTANQNLRLAMVNDFITYLNGLPANSNVLLGGDLNLYRASEPAFQELIDATNHITFEDPANRVGSWSNNTSYLDVFTQSTRTAFGLGGATGGFDDRFDFILTSESMATNPELSFVPGSYKVYGNNNNSSCYNSEINSVDCSGSDYNLTIRNALYYMSDHLPVTLELQTNKTLNVERETVKESIKIEGSNIINDILRLRIKNNLEINSLSVYNVLGQKVEVIKLLDRNFVNLNVSYLSSGIYYISTNSNNMKPLKFIKK